MTCRSFADLMSAAGVNFSPASSTIPYIGINSIRMTSGRDSDVDVTPSKARDGSPSSTPRKNKRKSSSPRRRDFSIKRLCLDSTASVPGITSNDDVMSRSGYSDNPPSTPETSASSNTPSPPDATSLKPKARFDLVTSKRDAKTSPAPPSLPPPAAYPSLPFPLPPYDPQTMSLLHMNPLLVHHMMALQQQSLTSAHLLAPQPPPPPSAVPLNVPAPSAKAPSRSQPAPTAKTSTVTSPEQTRTANKRRTSTFQPPPAAKPRATPAKTSKARNDAKNTSSHSNSFASSSRASDLSFASDNEDDGDGDPQSGGRRRKNYKNMTRERRIEANARERSRVHTISAAFDTLRRSVPAFSHNQRLSKLAILRIACSYISSLATLAGSDYSAPGQPSLTFEESVDQCTRTIQNEGRAKRRQ